MTMGNPEHNSREAQAAREVGVTEVSRGVAVTLTVLFVLLGLVVPTIEVILDARAPGSP